MSENLVRYESRPPAVVLTMNRPDRRNALSRGLIAALSDAFQHARDDAATRCVILTGAGPVFCAGMDLAELEQALHQKESDSVWDDALRLATLYDLIYMLPKPTIAAVNGAAVAGGAGMVTVCDLAVAVPEAAAGSSPSSEPHAAVTVSAAATARKAARGRGGRTGVSWGPAERCGDAMTTTSSATTAGARLWRPGRPPRGSDAGPGQGAPGAEPAQERQLASRSRRGRDPLPSRRPEDLLLVRRRRESPRLHRRHAR